jgi:hypothetical protein
VIEFDEQPETAIGRDFVFEIPPDLLGRVVLVTGR